MVESFSTNSRMNLLQVLADLEQYKKFIHEHKNESSNSNDFEA
jgi:hypothetical protein